MPSRVRRLDVEVSTLVYRSPHMTAAMEISCVIFSRKENGSSKRFPQVPKLTRERQVEIRDVKLDEGRGAAFP